MDHPISSEAMKERKTVNVTMRPVFKTKIDVDENGVETRSVDGLPIIEIRADCDLQKLTNFLALKLDEFMSVNP